MNICTGEQILECHEATDLRWGGRF